MLYDKFENRADRAKQFTPFDALKGFREALAQEERIIMDKKELSDEQMFKIDQTLHQLNVSDTISVIYYSNGEYIKKSGIISRFEPGSRFLSIDNTKILFDDIYELDSL